MKNVQIEIKNILYIRDKGRKDEVRGYFDLLDVLRGIIINKYTDEDDEFSVLLCFENYHMKSVSYKNLEEAQAFYNAVRDVLTSSDESFRSIDVLSFGDSF